MIQFMTSALQLIGDKYSAIMHGSIHFLFFVEAESLLAMESIGRLSTVSMNKTKDNKKQSLSERMRIIFHMGQAILIKVMIRDEIINNLPWGNIITEASNRITFLQMFKLNRISHLAVKVYK